MTQATFNCALGIDHVGFVCTELTAFAEFFDRLGFTLTPLARHEGKPTANQCIMLAEGYLELIARVDPAGESAAFSAMLARGPGAHIIALTVMDAADALARVQRAGLAVADVVPGARGDVRYTTVPLTDAPEGRLLLIQHLTPEALRPQRFLGHVNRAVALREVIIATDAPAEAAARLSRLAGRPVQPDPLGGFVLTLGAGQLRMLPPDAIRPIFPEAKLPSLPWIAGISLLTDDRNAALRRRLAYWTIPHETHEDAITVAAGGTFIRFQGK
jgi:catechol 2,3-dioxygenase-like lactoylglutathione lyase family enzyme